MTTINAVNSPLSGTTGTGSFVGSTSATLVTPILGAATATSLTLSSTTGIVGTTTNNSAAAGSVGEFITSNIASGSPVTLTSSTRANVTMVSLTAGDWDVWGNIFFAVTVTESTQFSGWISTTSAVSAMPDNSQVAQLLVNSAYFDSNGFTVPNQRISVATTTTVYLGTVYVGGGSTVNASGNLSARRVR